MKRQGSVLWLLFFLLPLVSSAQIDPVKRDLIQVGYNGVFEGRQPFSGYAFYYHNQPNFLQESNLTMRLAVAPTYMDNELGIANALGPNTDLGIGIAGGGFADSYNEFQDGQYLPQQSFDGFGGEGSMSLYHLFDPGRLIPLYGVLRGTTHYSTYSTTSDTEPGFELPPDHLTGSVRAGLRFGGVEPTLFPSLAMELSVWYEGDWRSKSGSYGPPAGSAPDTPYELNPQSQLFWAEAALSYTLDNKQNFYVRITAGTSLNADRFSAYRLGAFLPLVAEFPLSIPGFYYQEISAKQFVLLNANYLVPLDKKNRWALAFNASTAAVDYLPGTGQPGNSLIGVAGGVMWTSPNQHWKIITDYARGINAVRNGERGSNSIGVLMQVDLGAPGNLFHLNEPSLWQGFQRMLDLRPFSD
jgi:hypothetical protein